MTPAIPIPEPDYPYPPRYWWLKRIGAVLGILLLLLVLVRLILGWDANRKLQAEIDAIRARGEPVLPEDFAEAPMADDQNYVHFVNSAVATVNTSIDSPSSSLTDFANYPPYSAEWFGLAEKAIAGNQAALQILRSARELTKSNWGFVPSATSFNVSMKPLTKGRHIANLLTDKAIYNHLKGNDAEALNGILDALLLSQGFRSQPFLVGYLTGVGIDALAVDRMQMIAPGLRLEQDDHLRPKAEQIIKLMLSDWPDGNAMRALQAERAYVMAIAQEATAHTPLLAPMYKLDQVRHMKTIAIIINSTTQPSLRPVFSTLSDNSVFPKNASDTNYSRFFSRTAKSLFRIASVEYRNDLDRRAAAISLAARLYQFDHNGKWPPSLADLVPKYLPSIPIDPLSQTQLPLTYILDADGVRPMIYSPGMDGKDQRQQGAVPSVNPQYGWQTISPTIDDQFRDLSRFAPATQPAP